MIALIPIDAEMSPLLEGDGSGFEARYGASLAGEAELCRSVVAQTLDLLARVPREAQWGGFLTVDEALRSVVGMCGYKSGPTAAGEIEIAYGTLPPFEKQGYATAVAAELTRRALADERVRTVLAHTLPERNASGRLLQKNGFTHVGEVVDPEDGPVWRWERRREA